MDPELLPTLISYYQETHRTTDLAYRFDLRRQAHELRKSQTCLDQSLAENQDLQQQIKELKINLAEVQSLVETRQRENESLRSRHQDTDKADRAHAQTLKVQADSYKRELSELCDDLKRRDEELVDLRQDAIDRENDLKQAREVTRTRERELKESRDFLRARESEVRRASHTIETLQSSVQRLEMDLSDSRDALESAQEVMVQIEESRDAAQAQLQILIQNQNQARAAKIRAPIKPVASVPRPDTMTLPQTLPAIIDQLDEQAVGDVVLQDAEEEVVSPNPMKNKNLKLQNICTSETDYNEPPSARAPAQRSPTKRATVPKKTKTVSPEDKENQGVSKKPTKKRKTAEDFSATPPRSSPQVESPPREKTKKPDFTMTPFVDKSSNKSVLSSIPLSPPVPTKTMSVSFNAKEVLIGDEQPKLKKKRKLLGGTKTLMDDDTPKKAKKPSLKTNFGKELSPLKRPISSVGLIIRD